MPPHVGRSCVTMGAMTVDTSAAYDFTVGGALTGPQNLIPPAVSRMEGDDLSIFNTHGTGAVLSFDTTWSSSGAQSLRCTAGSGSSNAAGAIFRDDSILVTPGETYRINARVRRGSGTAAARLTIKWRDSTGAQAGSEVLGPLVSTTVGSVNTLTFDAVCPAVAAGGTVHVIVRYTVAPSTGQYLQIDDVELYDLGVV